MSVTLNGSSGVTTPGISNSEGYTGDGLSIAAGAPSGAVAVDSSGNVGIGTSSPMTFSGYTSLTLNNATNGSIINMQVNGVEHGRVQTYANTLSLNATSASGNIIFNNGNVGETARINSSGNLLINTTSGSYKLTLNGQPGANGYTAWTNYSDARLKENVTDFVAEPVLDKVCALRPVTFNYNDKTGFDEATRQRRISGFIAQELQEVFPDMVGTVDINGDEYLDTNLSNLTLYLLQAVKELKAEIDTLKAR